MKADYKHITQGIEVLKKQLEKQYPIVEKTYESALEQYHNLKKIYTEYDAEWKKVMEVYYTLQNITEIKTYLERSYNALLGAESHLQTLKNM